MKVLGVLALVLSGCAGDVVLARLQEDIEGLRQRVYAREEIKIAVAAAEPITKSRGDVSEPHVTVAVPPCPPPQAGMVQQLVKKKMAGKRPRRQRR